MSIPLPVDPAASDQSKRRTLLRIGHTLGWWDYQSENQAGHVDGRGHVYDGVTYTLVWPSSPVRPERDRERTLHASEVLGFVAGVADVRGELDEVAYRVGLGAHSDPDTPDGA